MIVRYFLLGFVLSMPFGGEAADKPASKESARKKSAKQGAQKREPLSTMTGCLDERPGPIYVLRAEGSLQKLADLEPEAFPVEGFAKYLGQKVTVVGRVERPNDTTVMRVQAIETIAERCSEPPQP
jgi:hypothetical protein